MRKTEIILTIIIGLLGLTIDGNDGNSQPISTEDQISSEIFDGYKSVERPPPYNGTKRTEVIVSMKILSITSVDVKSMQFTLDMYLRQAWVDTRLSWDRKAKFKDFKNFITTNENRKRAWIPDLFFRNGKHGRIHKMTCENMLFRINPNGQVLLSQKVTMTFSCAMNFATFPMDTQVCKLNIGSYGYTTDELYFKWKPTTNTSAPITLANLQIPEFATPNGIPTEDCTKGSGQTTGSYSCLEAYITLERQIGWWLANTFVPNILVVMVSWLNFWISLDAVPARVTLGFLTLLVTLTQSVSKGSPLPRVSYIKAIDVWTMACIIFNVGVLVEYAVASNMARKSRDQTWKKEVRETVREEITKWCDACLNQYNLRGRSAPVAYYSQSPLSYVNSAAKAAMSIKQGNLKLSNEVQEFLMSHDINFEDESNRPPMAAIQNPVLEQKDSKKKKKKPGPNEISIIDKRSRIGFPIMFSLFNCFYWTYYYVYKKQHGAYLELLPKSRH